MNKYLAVFEVPAIVRITIEVDAENQQDGLISAHDLIQQADPAKAVVESLQLDKAANVSFERAPDAGPVMPPSPLEAAGTFRVRLFDSDKQSGPPAKELTSPNFAAAKQLAESVLAPDSRYGSSQVLDEWGVPVMSAQSPRGNWEVVAFSSTEDTEGTVHSWLDSKATAATTALTLLKRADVKYVRIVDFTDRQAGQRLYREIR